jgi:hypothetical protein
LAAKQHACYKIGFQSDSISAITHVRHVKLRLAPVFCSCCMNGQSGLEESLLPPGPGQRSRAISCMHQGVRFTTGFALFVFSGGVFAYGQIENPSAVYDPNSGQTNWTNPVMGALQTVGLLLMFVSDLVSFDCLLCRKRLLSCVLSAACRTPTDILPANKFACFAFSLCG